MATIATAVATTVFTAVNGSVGSIKIFLDWANNVEQLWRGSPEVGEKLVSLRDQLQMHETALDTWRKYWDIEETTDVTFLRELWGEKHLLIISGALAEFNSTCDKFKNELKQFPSGGHSKQVQQCVTGDIAFPSGAALSSARRDDASEAMKGVSMPKVIEFLRQIEPETTKWLKSLDAVIVRLQDTAQQAFLAKHGKPISGALDDEQLDELRRLEFLQIAMDQRQPSEDLFNSVPHALKVAPPLAIQTRYVLFRLDLIGEEHIDLLALSSLKGQYCLVVRLGDSEEKLCIEGKFHDLNAALNFAPNSNGTIRSICEAYSELQNDNTKILLTASNDYFTCKKIGGHFSLPDGPNSWFGLPSPLEMMLCPLAEFESRRSTTWLDLGQRMLLACKIAECQLLVGSTSWLSLLRTRNIQCYPKGPTSSDLNLEFILDTPNTARQVKRTNAFENSSASAQKMPWQDLNELAVDAFRVGLILLEIGTGEILCGLEGKMPAERFKMRRPQTDIQHAEWKPLALLLDNLTRDMGDEYTSATRYCLKDMRMSCETAIVQHRSLEASQSAIKHIYNDFYVQVYDP